VAGCVLKLKKILLVDDDSTLIAMLNLILGNRKLEWEFLSVNSGDEALGILRSYDPDITILDLKMPGMDGFELVQRIRQQKLPAGKIIMLSAVDDDKIRKKALSSGILEFWTKPVAIRTLEANLSNLLG